VCLVEARLAGARDLNVMSLAVELAVVLLEGLQVQRNGTLGTLHAKLVVGLVAHLDGFHRVNSLATIRTRSRHIQNIIIL